MISAEVEVGYPWPCSAQSRGSKTTNPQDFQQLEQERDLLLRLLQMGRRTELEPLLEEALALMLQVAGAERGYIEAFAADDDGGQRPRWSAASALSDERIDAVRDAVSRGIIAESLERGEVLETVSAFADPRFAAFDSVQRGGIEAVLCVPVGTAPPAGFLYLEGRSGGGRFGPNVRRLAELFAAQAGPALARVIAQRRDADPDPTAPFRARLIADDLLGRSAAMAHVLEQIALLAPIDISVLITGPSGSGKSDVARIIVRNGPRAGGPLVELNCATLPDELLESELFGAVPGAHSAATRHVEGKVSAAEGGTLFLDEVSELSLRAQAKLLQLIQDKTYFRLGATTPSVADIRLIAATHRDLTEAVADGTFRQDLFYRLSVMPLRIPGLDVRLDDIPLLMRAFALRGCARHGLRAVTLSPGATSAAVARPWPGHVRELKHCVEAALIRAHGAGSDVLQPEHLFPDGDGAGAGASADGPSLYEATQSLQRSLILAALKESDGNVSQAARRLRVARSHLYTLMRSLDLQRGDD